MPYAFSVGLLDQYESVKLLNVNNVVNFIYSLVSGIEKVLNATKISSSKTMHKLTHTPNLNSN